VAAVGEHRLVTAVGPGGIGKTRLALAVAAELAGRFADRAWYVDLVPVTESGVVGPAVAKVLGRASSKGTRPRTRYWPGWATVRRCSSWPTASPWWTGWSCCLSGAVALSDQRTCGTPAGPRSDRLGEFGERCGHPLGRWDVESEFVVAAPEVLHEGVPGDDHLRCLIGT
jgi:hypothetical protein